MQLNYVLLNSTLVFSD